jgi:hypothetical protein
MEERIEVQTCAFLCRLLDEENVTTPSYQVRLKRYGSDYVPLCCLEKTVLISKILWGFYSHTRYTLLRPVVMDNRSR